MNAKRVSKILIDIVLTAMIVAEMLIQFTGVFLHEVIGFVFFASVITHLALSAKWIKNTASNAAKGKMTARRTALAVMGILLAITMVVLGVSSVAISSILASAGFTWTLGSYSLWTTIHSVSSYALCALVTVHLCMHWAFLASAFRVPYDPSRRRAIGTTVNTVAAVGALALGVMAVRQAMPTAGNGNGYGNGTGTGSGNGYGYGASNNEALEASDISGDSSSSEQSQHKGKGKRATGDTSSSSASSSSSSAPNNTSNETTPESSNTDTGSSSSDVSGICTLCRKQCPLSAPQCDRPYREGLL